MVLLPGQMVLHTLVNSLKTIFKVVESINGLMEDNMKVIGITTKWKALVHLHGLMAENMKEST